MFSTIDHLSCKHDFIVLENIFWLTAFFMDIDILREGIMWMLCETSMCFIFVNKKYMATSVINSFIQENFKFSSKFY